MDQLLPFLDPALNYLETNLPPPLYALLTNLLSHVLALCTASFRLVGSLIATHPQDWDLQTVLPPILTLLAAYLALLSLYRTAAWVVKLTFFFVKWGSIIAILSLGAGWLAAVTSTSGDGNNGLADIVSGWMDGRTGATSRPRYGSRVSSSPGSRTYRESNKFDGPVRGWQYQENPQQPEPNEAQNVIQNIIVTAGQMLDGTGWWELTKIVSGAQQPAEAKEERTKGRTRSR